MAATRKTVRVFISSTFRDMHAERDHLVTVVFPELRERLERLDLDFYDVDLRWGVPQTGVDGERINSWAYCKQWIDRVEPFFVCIVGERYGWTPPPEEIHDVEDRAAYAGLSITEMEIRHAVIGGQRRHHSFFFFRRPQVPENTPPAIYHEFVDAADRERLRELKTQIQLTGRPVRPYDCQWTGQGFENLEAFGQMVLDDLWSGVLRDARYVPPEVWQQVRGHDPDDDPLYADERLPVPSEVWESIVQLVKPALQLPIDAEKLQMAEFAESRLRWFQGRQSELRQLAAFVDNDVPPATGELCVVGAVAGQGKSALLAKFATQLADTQHLLITHFVGATDRSADVRSLLERLNQELERSGIEWPADSNLLQDTDSLTRRLAERLGSYSGQRRIILMIDAINQLTDGHDLSWLPQSIGPSVRIIVSTIEDRSLPEDSSEGQIAAALRARTTQPKRIELQPLDAADVRQIVVDYLHEYCKELDREHIDSICRMDEARNPLYLLIMLHELRTLGGNDMHRIVPQLIADFPKKYPNSIRLFDWVLERLDYFGREAVRLWCSYLYLGRVGMSSRELSDLLAAKLGPEASRSALRIERGIRRYLQHRGPQLDFFHGQLREAVRLRYLTGDTVALHADIAHYLETRWREPNRHALNELPYHQTQGLMWEVLSATLGDSQFINEKESAALGDSLHQDYRFGIEHAVAVGRPFVAASLAMLQSRLVLDSAIRTKPGQLGLIVHLIAQAGDRPLMNRVLSAVLQGSDATIRTGVCLEVLLAGGRFLLPDQRDRVLTAVRQGLTAAASLPRSPNPAIIRDTNVIHGRAYEVFFLLAYIRAADALADALRTYSQLSEVWTITEYAARAQVETSTVRRNHIESMFEVANEFPIVAEAIGPLIGGIDALILLDAGRFTTIGDLFSTISPQIQPDLFFQIVFKSGGADLLTAWLAQLNAEPAPPYIKPHFVRMMLELSLGHRAEAIRAFQELEPSTIPGDEEFQFLAARIEALPIWIRHGEREFVAEVLRDLRSRADRQEPARKMALLREWLYFATRSDWPVDELRDVWYQTVELWKECRGAAPFYGYSGCQYFKVILPKHVVGAEGLREVDDWMRSLWRDVEPRDLENTLAFADYARGDPQLPDLLAEITNRFIIHLQDIDSRASTDQEIEHTLYYGEAILTWGRTRSVPGATEAMNRLVGLLPRLRDEKRFGERARSLLCNLSRSFSLDGSALARQLISSDYRPPLQVLEVVTQYVTALVQAEKTDPDRRLATAAMARARSRRASLTPGDFRAFGSVIMASRTRYYSADLINDESRFQMVGGGRGAHIDAFDDVPEEEGEWILRLLKAETLAALGRTAEAERELKSSMKEAMATAMPADGEMTRNRDSQALSLAIWFWSICGPLAKRLGMAQPIRGEWPLAVPDQLTERTGFEDTYRYLGMSDRWANDINPELLTTIILRAADEPLLRCRFLLMFLLRGLAYGKRIADYNQDSIDQSALDELLASPAHDSLYELPDETEFEDEFEAESTLAEEIEDSGFLARRYCHLCGQKISETPSTAACSNCDAQLIHDETTQMDCLQCGALVPGDARFCIQCGAKQ